MERLKKAESYKDLQEGIRKLKIEPPLQAFENKYQDKECMVQFHTEEFSAVCPRTGLPDYAEIYLRYIPNKKVLESKSCKLYLTAYRNIGIFHEHAINKIFEDFIKVVDPKEAYIRGEFNARGGIDIVVEREYKKNINKKLDVE